MNRRLEYICTLLIVMIVNLGAFSAWNYCGSDSPAVSIFSPGAGVAMAESDPLAAAQTPPPPTSSPSAEYMLGYHTGESWGKPAAPADPLSIPILMYHRINPYHDTSLYRIWPEEFDWQMQYLKDNGYHSVSITAILDYYQKGLPLPEKPVVITLDDGYRDNYIYALPILEKYGFTATIFITTNTVSAEGADNNFLTWNMIREMSNRGITFGCHTLDHSQLTRVSWDEAWRQVADSKNVIEAELGKKVEVFSYPYGLHNYDVETIVKDCGFRAAVTVNPEHVSSADNPFTLNRMGIYSNLSRDGFIYKISSR